MNAIGRVKSCGRFVVGTPDRRFCQRCGWMHRTFQVIVTGKKLAVSAGNLMHLLSPYRCIANR